MGLTSHLDASLGDTAFVLLYKRIAGTESKDASDAALQQAMAEERRSLSLNFPPDPTLPAYVVNDNKQYLVDSMGDPGPQLLQFLNARIRSQFAYTQGPAHPISGHEKPLLQRW